ncbi:MULTISPECIES: CGNR zinc finger domain-containing protein [unclassified Kribbella]|uniref:CGNR zinc finger domain-containing protein n=1 Tax=unclassified Kribbella TaxID=2644121 RepID=UPI0033E9ACF7
MSHSFALPLPGEPAPVRLMNTIWADRHGVYDALVDVGDLRSWLTALGPAADPAVPGRLVTADLTAYRTLRDALRRLAALLTEDTRSAAATDLDVEQAVADVNHAVTAGSNWPQLSLRRGHLEQHAAGTASPAMRSLSAIATEAIQLFTGEDPLQLKACQAPSCVLYFVKNHPRREWCSTACGNRARVARHYQRHH